MPEDGLEYLEKAVRDLPTLQFVPEQNKAGTWSISAYLVRNGIGREHRLVANCETSDDAFFVLKSIWSDFGTA